LNNNLRSYQYYYTLSDYDTLSATCREKLLLAADFRRLPAAFQERKVDYSGTAFMPGMLLAK
jgi:hypothetical protein